MGQMKNKAQQGRVKTSRRGASAIRTRQSTPQEDKGPMKAVKASSRRVAQSALGTPAVSGTAERKRAAGKKATDKQEGRESLGIPGTSGASGTSGAPGAPGAPEAYETYETPQTPEDLLYGSNPVREALRKGRPISRVWVSRERDDKVTAEIIGLCKKANIPFHKMEKAYLDRMCPGVAHQGFAAQAAPKEYSPWRSMLAQAAAKGEAPLLVLLDEVEDPYNLGAVLRSVDALGAHGAVIPKHRASPLTAGVARASAGAWEYVSVDRITNMNQTIEEMKAEGLWVIGAAADAAQSIYQTDLTGPVAIVMGGENKGLSPLVRRHCDALVSIPMSGQVNSLNVSAASAIILSEINRQRRIGKG